MALFRQLLNLSNNFKPRHFTYGGSKALKLALAMKYDRWCLYIIFSVMTGKFPVLVEII